MYKQSAGDVRTVVCECTNKAAGVRTIVGECTNKAAAVRTIVCDSVSVQIEQEIERNEDALQPTFIVEMVAG